MLHVKYDLTNAPHRRCCHAKSASLFLEVWWQKLCLPAPMRWHHVSKRLIFKNSSPYQIILDWKCDSGMHASWIHSAKQDVQSQRSSCMHYVTAHTCEQTTVQQPDLVTAWGSLPRPCVTVNTVSIVELIQTLISNLANILQTGLMHTYAWLNTENSMLHQPIYAWHHYVLTANDPANINVISYGIIAYKILPAIFLVFLLPPGIWILTILGHCLRACFKIFLR